MKSKGVMRIVIDDSIARLEGKEEREILKGQYIRFEIEGKAFTVSFSERGIVVRESTGRMLTIDPQASNMIEIR